MNSPDTDTPYKWNLELEVDDEISFKPKSNQIIAKDLLRQRETSTPTRIPLGNVEYNIARNDSVPKAQNDVSCQPAGRIASSAEVNNVDEKANVINSLKPIKSSSVADMIKRFDRSKEQLSLPEKNRTVEKKYKSHFFKRPTMSHIPRRRPTMIRFDSFIHNAPSCDFDACAQPQVVELNTDSVLNDTMNELEPAKNELFEANVKLQTEREEAELKAQMETEREADKLEAKLQADREVIKARVHTTESETVELEIRMQAEREAIELEVKLQAEREAAELEARPQAERDAVMLEAKSPVELEEATTATNEFSQNVSTIAVSNEYDNTTSAESRIQTDHFVESSNLAESTKSIRGRYKDIYIDSEQHMPKYSQAELDAALEQCRYECGLQQQQIIVQEKENIKTEAIDRSEEIVSLKNQLAQSTQLLEQKNNDMHVLASVIDELQQQQSLSTIQTSALTHRLQSLEADLAKSENRLAQEISSLNSAHSTKLVELASTHVGEVQRLEKEKERLEKEKESTLVSHKLQLLDAVATAREEVISVFLFVSLLYSLTRLYLPNLCVFLFVL